MTCHINRLPSRLLTLLAIAAAVGTAADAQVHVDGSAPPNGTGANWSSPYDNLQSALDDMAALPIADRIIYVAIGTYVPTATSTASDPRTASFLVPQGTTIYGGFKNGETLAGRSGLSRQTILSGDLAQPMVSDNAYHVVEIEPGDMAVYLDKMTIRGGHANGTSSVDQRRGGGIFCSGAHLEVRDLFVDLNFAEEEGGAIYFDGGISASRSLRMFRSYLSNNRANDRGGAVFIQNAGDYLGDESVHGVEPSWIFNTVFYRNLAGEQSLTSNELFENGGGALFIESVDDGPDLLVDGANPSASIPNVGLLVVNSIFNDNLCHGGGAAVRLNNNGAADTTVWASNTLGYNQVLTNPPGSLSGGGTVYTRSDSSQQPYFINSIVGLTFDTDRVLDTTDAIVGSGSRSVTGVVTTDSLEAYGCNIFTTASGTYPTSVAFPNLDVNPGYENGANRDFRLSASSLLLDAAVNPLASLPYDYPDMNSNGVPFEQTPYDYLTTPLSHRVVDLIPGGGTLDIGAHERD